MDSTAVTQDILMQRLKEAEINFNAKAALYEQSRCEYSDARDQLLKAQCELDDFTIKSWPEPDIEKLLDAKSGVRYFNELQDFLSTKFSDVMYTAGAVDKSSRHVLAIHLQSDDPRHIDLCEAAAKFFADYVLQEHGDSKGFSVFHIIGDHRLDCRFELWCSPSGFAYIVLYSADGQLIKKRSTVRVYSENCVQLRVSEF